MMPNVGGSATCYGVLYQILGAAHWAASIRLSASSEGQALNECRLCIEPAEGGGDLQVSGGDARRIVEQWKAKSDHGTWSLKQTVEKVLPAAILQPILSIHFWAQ